MNQIRINFTSLWFTKYELTLNPHRVVERVSYGRKHIFSQKLRSEAVADGHSWPHEF